MAENKSNNDDHGNRWIPVFVAVIGAFGGGAGANYLYFNQGLSPETLQSIARPDPYTGSRGKALEDRVSRLEQASYDLPPAEIKAEIKFLRRDLERFGSRLDAVERGHYEHRDK